MIVNENIIRNALNESIDEFLLEEGWMSNAWNGLKNSKLGKAGSWLKDAAAMYMDKKTNGQWNKKYNIYANGNGKTTELYYLNKWFDWHLKQMQSVAHNNPNSKSNISKYVAKNINPNNFNNWAGQYIKNRMGLKCIDNYIIKCQQNITDSESASKYLNVWSFMSDPEGQEYTNLNGKDLSDARQEHQNNVQAMNQQDMQNQLNAKKQTINHIKERIDNCKDFLNNLSVYPNGRVRMKGSNVHWVKWAEETINSLNNIPNEAKQWMDEVIARSFQQGPKYAASYLTYDNFIKSKYGAKYASLEQEINGK